MRSRPEFSAQTLSVLAALCEEPSQWRHGYALAGQTGLKSGTLYPILIRLADRGLVEALLAGRAAPGRPRRHLYRLTAAGLAGAAEAWPAPGAAPADGAAGRAGARPGRDVVARWSMSRLPAPPRPGAARRGCCRPGGVTGLEAVWAEAHEVPPGCRRLAWLAGGVRVIAGRR